MSGWFALLAPKGTPAAIVTKLNDTLKLAVADPQVHAGFERQGAETVYLPPDQAAANVAYLRQMLAHKGTMPLANQAARYGAGPS